MWEKTFFRQFDVDINAGSDYEHFFCGVNGIDGAICPNCKKPLLCFLTLDCSDPRIEVPCPTVPFLYCWSCKIRDHSANVAYRADEASGRRTQNESRAAVCLAGVTDDAVLAWGRLAPFYYQILSDGSVSLLQYGHGVENEGPLYDGYPDFFPGAPARLLEITTEAQDAIKKINRQDPSIEDFTYDFPAIEIPQHQVGGEPCLVQGDTDYRMLCLHCGQVMPLLGSIGNDCLDERGIMGDPYVQIIYHYCVDCGIVGAFNQAD
jgi:hypothetical protein